MEEDVVDASPEFSIRSWSRNDVKSWIKDVGLEDRSVTPFCRLPQYFKPFSSCKYDSVDGEFHHELVLPPSRGDSGAYG